MQGRSPSNGGWKLPFNGGWELKSGLRSDFAVPKDLSASRIWGRTNCKTLADGRFFCETGDCGFYSCAYGGIQRGGRTPATLAEFTLSGHGSQDYYDVSLVDGYNLKMSIQPKKMDTSQQGTYWCTNPNCVSDLNVNCPLDLQYKSSTTGQVIGCLSACEKFNADRYCCRNAYGHPETCPPTFYSKIFKNACPTAYSYAYDDKTSTFFCKNTGYDITFC
jgi:hypothetical protein